MLPAMVAGPLTMLKITGSPLAPPVAETVNGASPNVLPLIGAKVIVCAAAATVNGWSTGVAAA